MRDGLFPAGWLSAPIQSFRLWLPGSRNRGVHVNPKYNETIETLHFFFFYRSRIQHLRFNWFNNNIILYRYLIVLKIVFNM